jgi:hypothetical protein
VFQLLHFVFAWHLAQHSDGATLAESMLVPRSKTASGIEAQIPTAADGGGPAAAATAAAAAAAAAAETAAGTMAHATPNVTEDHLRLQAAVGTILYISLARLPPIPPRLLRCMNSRRGRGLMTTPTRHVCTRPDRAQPLCVLGHAHAARRH